MGELSVASLPGSQIKKPIRWIRQDHNPAGKAYRAWVDDGILQAIVSRDDNLWHISISHVDKDGKPDRCPTWDEMKDAKYRLVPANVAMVLIFPRRGVPYVNEHETCLHLWESTEKDIDL